MASALCQAPLVVVLQAASIELLLLALVLDPLHGNWEDVVGIAATSVLLLVILVAAYLPLALTTRGQASGRPRPTALDAFGIGRHPLAGRALRRACSPDGEGSRNVSAAGYPRRR